MDRMQRWLKLSIIFVIMSVFIFIAAFNNRQAIILHFVKPYLTPYNIVLSCAELKLASNLDLVIDKLCLNHEMLNVTLLQGKMTWSYQSGIKLKGIFLNKVDVQNIAPFEFKQAETGSKPLVELHSFLKQVSDFSLPLAININQFTYKTFNSNLAYSGKFLATDNDYNIQLSTPSQTQVIGAAIKILNHEINGKVTLNVKPTIDLLAAHGLTLPSEIDNNLNIKGDVRSKFNWKNSLLNIEQHTERLVVDSEAGILNSGPFSLKHNAVWHANIDDNEIDLVFEPLSAISINFEHETLLSLLKNKQVPSYLSDLIKRNKTEQIVINPKGNLKLNFEQQNIALQEIIFKALDNKKLSLIKLEALSTSYNFDRFKTKFDVKAQLNLSNEVIKDDAKFELLGQLHKNESGFFIGFDPTSHIILKRLRTESLYIPEVKTEFKGKVKYASKTGLSLALNLESNLKKGVLKNIIKTEQLVIESQINGTLENMKASGTLLLDNINLANYSIHGDIYRPYIDISMEQLNIPSLLELNILNKPDLALINGAIDYKFTGQLTDIEDIFNNELNLALSVKDVIGEVNSFWLENFNWQQNFELKNHKISTDDIANNISFGNIDAGTEVSELFATSSINFESNKLNINLLNVEAKAFGGRFEIPQLNWPINAKKAVTLKLEQVDLNKIVELEKQQGIIVTGKVSGNLPLYIGETIRIENGKLFNVSNGVIQIKDNTGVESLKQTSTELALAFDALENLHYHKLNADVSMYYDGRMLLDTVIKGRNPDLDNEVNLNLNINYDLLGLIKSLRIADNMESEIIQKLQQKD